MPAPIRYPSNDPTERVRLVDLKPVWMDEVKKVLVATDGRYIYPSLEENLAHSSPLRGVFQPIWRVTKSDYAELRASAEIDDVE